MAPYNVYYFVVKPTAVPEHQGTTGESAELSPGSEDVNTIRNEVLGQFETILRDLIQASVEHIPAGSKNFQVQIRRIPAASPGVPDYTGLSIGMRDPIVYLCTRNARDNPSDPQDRRPSLVFINAMHGTYDEMSDELYNITHNGIVNDPQTVAGKATNFSDYFPAIAEVFSDFPMAFDATNWREIQARTLAKVAFHEIAHNKCECENRATNSRWNPSIVPNSIHDESGVSICGGTVGHATSQSDGDKQLFGRHMLCPIKFYQLDQPVAGQFFHNGQSMTLPPASSGGAGDDDDDDSGSDTHDPLVIDDSDDPLAGL